MPRVRQLLPPEIRRARWLAIGATVVIGLLYYWLLVRFRLGGYGAIMVGFVVLVTPIVVEIVHEFRYYLVHRMMIVRGETCFGCHRLLRGVVGEQCPECGLPIEDGKQRALRFLPVVGVVSGPHGDAAGQ